MGICKNNRNSVQTPDIPILQSDTAKVDQGQIVKSGTHTQPTANSQNSINKQEDLQKKEQGNKNNQEFQSEAKKSEILNHIYSSEPLNNQQQQSNDNKVVPDQLPLSSCQKPIVDNTFVISNVRIQIIEQNNAKN